MSDTPIDRHLEHKKSFRNPEFLLDRVEMFRENYNDRLADLSTDAPATAMELSSDSDAFRRIIDIGLGAWWSGDVPTGFSFNPPLEIENDDHEVYCPQCDQDRIEKLRLKAGAHDEDGFEFDVLHCLTCERDTALADATRMGLF